MDQTRAFDSVVLNILINKLKEIGIENHELNLLKEFIIDRKQIVQIDKNFSNEQTVKSGVPQGAKLASHLFIIYINGILKLILDCFAQFYADDGVLAFEADSFEELIEKMKNTMTIIHNWCEQHNLKLNISKTKMMIFENHVNIPKIDIFKGIKFKNEVIERVTNIKYLGLNIDSKFKWDTHVNEIKSKILPISFAIYRARKYIPRQQLWMIYHSHFYSHVTYLSPIWSGCAAFRINEIQRIQNKTIKSIEGKDRLTPSHTL